MILNEKLYPFIAFVFNIHRNGVLTARFRCCTAGATWNCCRHGARFVYMIQPSNSLQRYFIRSHIIMYGARVFSRNLSPALLARWWNGDRCQYMLCWHQSGYLDNPQACCLRRCVCTWRWLAKSRLPVRGWGEVKWTVQAHRSKNSLLQWTQRINDYNIKAAITNHLPMSSHSQPGETPTFHTHRRKEWGIQKGRKRNISFVRVV